MTSTRSLRAVVAQRAGQRVVVADVGGHIDAVQDHVGGAQHVRQRLLLDAVDALLQELLVVRRFHLLLADVFDGAGEEAAGAAGGVEDRLAQLGVDRIDHELGDGARRVVLAGIAGALQVAQDLLVDVAEQVAVLRLVEIDAVDDLVDHLPQQRAGLHVVVGILEDGADHEAALVVVRRLAGS